MSALRLTCGLDPADRDGDCDGNATCESIAAKSFRFNDDRQSDVIDPMANTEAEILESAENCPVSAIFVEDAETGERLFP
jgi:ferredoxin